MPKRSAKKAARHAPRRSPGTTTLTFTLPEEMKGRVEVIAKDNHRSQSNLMNYILDWWMKVYEKEKGIAPTADQLADFVAKHGDGDSATEGLAFPQAKGNPEGN